MEKPKKPIEPNIKNYPIPTVPNGVNAYGETICIRVDYIRDYQKWAKEMKKYDADLETYEQLKLIRLIKNAHEKYCLKNYKITKK